MHCFGKGFVRVLLPSWCRALCERISCSRLHVLHYQNWLFSLSSDIMNIHPKYSLQAWIITWVHCFWVNIIPKAAYLGSGWIRNIFLSARLVCHNACVPYEYINCVGAHRYPTLYSLSPGIYCFQIEVMAMLLLLWQSAALLIETLLTEHNYSAGQKFPPLGGRGIIPKLTSLLQGGLTKFWFKCAKLLTSTVETKESLSLSIHNCPWVNPIQLTIWVTPWYVWVLWCMLLGYVMHQWAEGI